MGIDVIFLVFALSNIFVGIRSILFKYSLKLSREFLKIHNFCNKVQTLYKQFCFHPFSTVFYQNVAKRIIRREKVSPR